MGETSTSVFGPQFCGPHPVDLTIFGTGGIFTVSNAAADHAVKFRVVKIDSGLRQIWDAAGNPIATLRRKWWSAYGTWEVFRGETNKKEDKVFSLASPSIFNFKLNYHVFLATNQHDHDGDCDFKINGKWKNKKKTLSIYAAKSPTNNIVSRVEQKQKAKNWDELEVKVEANMDQAFVVAVIMIVAAIYEEEPRAGAGRAGRAAAAAAASSATQAGAAAAAASVAATF